MTKANLKYFIPAGFWAMVILLLSSKAKVRMKETWLDLLSIDKFGHAFFYGVLCILILWGLGKQSSGKKVKIWPAILGCTLYGIVIEIMQFTVFMDRQFELLDIIANFTGVFLGAIIFNYINK